MASSTTPGRWRASPLLNGGTRPSKGWSPRNNGRDGAWAKKDKKKERREGCGHEHRPGSGDPAADPDLRKDRPGHAETHGVQIGRASCRARGCQNVEITGVGGS